jgi:predicted metal-dependent phosphoesterase TrpH
MRRFVDLHTHSTASDGRFSPRQIIRLAESRRLAAVALTDHDTTDGLAEARAAAGEFPRLRFVPGVEISARCPDGTLHILGLGVDEMHAGLQDALGRLRAARNERNPRILACLRSLGVNIDMEEVLAVVGSGRCKDGDEVVGRLHIAEALRRKKYVRSVQDAFDRYIGSGKPAYVDKERMEPREAIRAIRQSGGIAVLAHPVQLKYGNAAQLERIVRSMISAGIGGIEVYHSDHSPEQTRSYLDLARRFDLLVTGGSDFHGPGKPDALLGRPRVPLAAMEEHWARRLLGPLEG